MATIAQPVRTVGNPTYPTSDGKPIAGTDYHRKLLVDALTVLTAWFWLTPNVYITGGLLLFYQPGNRRRHIAPDLMVVKGVARGDRLNYVVWEEGRSPAFVIEITSSSTRRQDTHRKFQLYRDVLRVKEYFLFDPLGDYLHPGEQGYRLRGGEYVPIKPVNGRLPSKELGLHLEREGNQLRFWNPETSLWLPTPAEAIAMRDAQLAVQDAQLAAREAEIEQLREELDALRGQSAQGKNGSR